MQTLTSERVILTAKIDPASYAAGTSTSSWVNAKNFTKFMATLDLGVMTAGSTVDFTIQQATDNTGTSAKAAKTNAQLTQAGGDNGTSVVLDLDPNELDVDNGFTWIAVRCVVAVAASILGADLYGEDPIYGYDTSVKISFE